MARPRRLNLPGIPLHIVQRGNNSSACFFEDIDYSLYLKLLREFCLKRHCSLHAYVLMTNHVHLLLTPSEENSASFMMMDLGRSYVRYVNDKYHRTGTLWEGRFKTSLVDSARYCLACYRYIELNPVRAGMVKHPADYPWSSYHANAYGEDNHMLKPHSEWMNLGVCGKSRRQAYRRLFFNGNNEQDFGEIRFGLRKGLPVGGKNFRQEVEARLGIRLGTGKRGRRKKGSWKMGSG